MIKIEQTEVVGWEHVIRGMRNPKNSWGLSDSYHCVDRSCVECPQYDFEDSSCKVREEDTTYYIIGPNDHKLMMGLASGGPVHAKYRRMITVYMDVTAPLYWWKEFDTYKVGTVANSCSTMHKIDDKEFTLDDFSCEHLVYHSEDGSILDPMSLLDETIRVLNHWRERFIAEQKINEILEVDKKDMWWQMIQLLPSSYNQKRTIMLNYEVLHNIYISRKGHKLDEWHTFCDWIESLPYSELITEKKGK